jgi:hypothetical protein
MKRITLILGIICIFSFLGAGISSTIPSVPASGGNFYGPVTFTQPITTPGVTSTGLTSTRGITSTALATPVNGTFTVGAGILGTATYYYRVTALNTAGETLPSTETSLAVTGPAGVNVNWGAVTGAASYKVYGRSTGAELYMATVTASATTWLDAGSVTPSGALPTAGTSATISTVSGVSALNLTTTAASGAVALSGVNGSKFCPGANTSCLTSNGTTISVPYLTATGGLYVSSTDGLGATGGALTVSGNMSDSAGAISLRVRAANNLVTRGARIVTFESDWSGTVRADVDKDGMLRMGIGNTAAPPTCVVGLRGKLWYTGGGTGVTDTVSMCLKATADTYSWVTITTGG